MSQPAYSPGAIGVNRSWRSWYLTAWIAGVFSVLVGGWMMLSQYRDKTDDPFRSPQLKALKEKLRGRPTDESLKQEIRALDLQLRQRHFRHLSQMHSGFYLLGGGVAVFILAFAQGARLQKRPPMPQPRPDAAEGIAQATGLARLSVAVSGLAVGVLLFIVSLSFSSALPRRAEEVEKLLAPLETAVAGANVASPEEMRKNWPRFRGADGGGVSIWTNTPVSWDATNGTGIAWKSPTPAPGFGSPIVWGERLFLSGGDTNKREVICLDVQTGQTRWRQPVAVAPAGPGAEVPESTGWAASTMATDGQRVYAFFVNGDMAALDFEGKTVWSKSFSPLKNTYGHATSLAVWQGKVILQLDQGEKEDNKSKLYALDGRSGQVVWQTPRSDMGASWSSPIIFEAGGKVQILALSLPWAVAYNSADGAELWRVKCLSGEVTPSPIFAAGMAIVPSPSDKLVAIRPDGSGDVTKTHIAWTNEDNIPDVTSPVSNGELAFTLGSGGLVLCIDAKDGRKVWEHEYDAEFQASPSLAGNRLYLFGHKGTAIVVEASRQFKQLFKTEMPDVFTASPAFAQDRIFLRGQTNVWCLASDAGKAGKQP
jgi:outer membrane protein assembly factor BamB